MHTETPELPEVDCAFETQTFCHHSPELDSYDTWFNKVTGWFEDAEEIAHAFHDRYEESAPCYGYRAWREKPMPWEQVPEAKKSHIRETICRLIGDGVIQKTSRRKQS